LGSEGFDLVDHFGSFNEATQSHGGQFSRGTRADGPAKVIMEDFTRPRERVVKRRACCTCCTAPLPSYVHVGPPEFRWRRIDVNLPNEQATRLALIRWSNACRWSG